MTVKPLLLASARKEVGYNERTQKAASNVAEKGVIPSDLQTIEVDRYLGR